MSAMMIIIRLLLLLTSLFHVTKICWGDDLENEGRVLYLEDFGAIPDSAFVDVTIPQKDNYFFSKEASPRSPFALNMTRMNNHHHHPLLKKTSLSSKNLNESVLLKTISSTNRDAFNKALLAARPGDTVRLKMDETYTMDGGVVGVYLEDVTIDFAGMIRFVCDIETWPFNEETQTYLPAIHILNSTKMHITSSSTRRAKVIVDISKNIVKLDEDLYNLGYDGGIIDGRGKGWWDDVLVGNKLPRSGDSRPVLMFVESCVDVKVEYVTLINPPFWGLSMKVVGAEVAFVNVLVDRDYQRKLNPKMKEEKKVVVESRNLRSESASSLGYNFPDFLPNWLLQPLNLNTDGIDPRGTDIYIHDCIILNDDDSIAVKPSGNDSAALNGTVRYDCTRNVTMENLILTGVGASVGSVGPTLDHNCVDDVLFRNVVMPGTAKGIYIKSNRDDCNLPRTSSITNIRYENIHIKQPLWWPIWIGPQAMHTPHTSLDGWCPLSYPLHDAKCPTQACATFANITLKDVYVDDPMVSPGVILGNASNPITGLVLDNVTVRMPGRSLYGRLPFHEKHFPYRGKYQCLNALGVCKDCDPVPDCLDVV